MLSIVRASRLRAGMISTRLAKLGFVFVRAEWTAREPSRLISVWELAAKAAWFRFQSIVCQPD
jgi:hypothetical protein